MSNRNRVIRFLLLLTIFSLGAAGTFAQKGQKEKEKTAADYPQAKPLLWEPVNISGQDLFNGPGGTQMKPNLSNITFIEEDKSGHNKKYRIKDGSGREWVAKLGDEAQPETVAVRLLYGLGYKTEINYLVPSITIPGKGTFKNVRLEARPAGVKRLDEWKWGDNPFVGTNQLQGLKIMMVFLTNYDLLDMQNKVLYVKGPNGGELDYVISDLGSTIGKFGNNNLPIFFRLGRKTNDPEAWSKAGFIKGVENGQLKMDYTGGKSRGNMENISVEQGRWLYNRLSRLDDRQIEDAFRAANYSPQDVKLLTRAAKERISALGEATKTASQADAKY
jgi:hypothetical protein